MKESISEIPDELIRKKSSLVAEFFSIPCAEAEEKLRYELANKGELVRQAWNVIRPYKSEGIREFYQTTDAYVYDLVADHLTPSRREFTRVIVEYLKKCKPETVLDFGVGTGDDAIAINKMGLNVVSYDVPGLTFEYAKWRYAREGLAVRSVNILDAEEVFDAIISVEVLEHLLKPLDTLKMLSKHLQPDGRMLITQSFGLTGQEFPAHVPTNRIYDDLFSDYLKQIGLEIEADLYLDHLKSLRLCRAYSVIENLQFLMKRARRGHLGYAMRSRIHNALDRHILWRFKKSG